MHTRAMRERRRFSLVLGRIVLESQGGDPIIEIESIQARWKKLDMKVRTSFIKFFLILFLIIYQTTTKDCDYISHEIDASFWKRTFGNGKFHETQMELHVPCRDPIDHLLSQCNMRGKELNCSLSTNEYLKSVQGCFIQLNRFKSSLQNNFEIKCFNFKEQFTTYIDYMGERLQDRRFQSEPYIKRETNRLRNKTKECLLQRPDLMDITRELLLKFDYYKFCDSCTGSKNDITLRH